MQLFIFIAVLLIPSSAYLLHQFWTRALAGAAPPEAQHTTTIDDEDLPRAA